LHGFQKDIQHSAAILTDYIGGFDELVFFGVTVFPVQKINKNKKLKRWRQRNI
jgi:hypothetical protein